MRVALAFGLTVALVAGCGDLPASLDSVQTPEGSVDINYLISGRLAISRVDYEISGDALAPRTVQGSVDVRDHGATVSASVGGLPSAIGYRLAISAATDDRGAFCGGVAAFDVIAPLAARLDLSMVCVSAATVRTIDVGGEGHTCPSVASIAVAQTGRAITVSASAFSFDGLPASYAWDAPLGSFGAPGQDVSPYACDVAGKRTLSVTITDGLCGDRAFIDLNCPKS